MFEISLGWCFTALLQFVEIIFHLFGIQLYRQTLEVKGHGSYMAAIDVESSLAPSQDGNIAFKTLEQFFKAANFATGTVEVLVIP
jgi:hypothetical protein